MLKNKKADVSGEFVLWSFRFIMTIVVVAGIIAVAAILYVKQYDIRQVEATQINQKIFSCNLFQDETFNSDSLRKCLNIDEKEEYVNLTVEYNSKKKSAYIGDDSIGETCKIIEKFKIKPLCQKSVYYILFNSKERATLNVLVGIKKVEKNAV